MRKIVTIVGLGVVGGSFAMALKGKDYDVYGIDTDEDALRQAKEGGYIIEGFTEGKEILLKSDITFICLYPSAILEYLRTHKFKKGSIVSDCVGIKSYFLKDALEIIDDDIEYISGHPMAGRESRGFAFASAEVFIGANYIIVQHEKNDPEKIKFLQDFVADLGFKSVKILSPYDHDEIISFTSQLPHVIAISLINSDTQKFDTGKYIGDSYRDLTRIADVNEDLWTELFLNNKQALLQSIYNFEEQFDIMKKAIEESDYETLRNRFEEGGKRKRHLLHD